MWAVGGGRGRWAVGYGLWAVGCGRWAVGCGLWAVDSLWAVWAVLGCYEKFVNECIKKNNVLFFFAVKTTSSWHH